MMVDTWRPLIGLLTWRSPTKLPGMFANSTIILRSLYSPEGWLLMNDLNKELATEKKVAKSWADERAALIAERDDLRARYGELEQARAADNRRATEALEKATKERDATLASVASARVQFANQKIREFLNSPNYASKINGECAAYFTSLALDHKDRFLDLFTLFDEVKASKPDWYRGLSPDERIH
ncbi:hypothetical protein LIER_10197 [Lithospermum erythrorhizon]|uniref:Uncharacterized protein n=1 Tax=Lithospermum erythrorhizon TaxID=34254 RepID=A0AAV3PMP7_LITER